MGFPLSAANSCKTRCHQVSRNTFSVSPANSSNSRSNHWLQVFPMTREPLTTFNCWQKFKCQQFQSRGPRPDIWNRCCRHLCSWWEVGESLLIQVLMHVCDKRGWCFSLGNILYMVHSSTHGSKAHRASSGILHSQYNHFSFYDLLETSNLQPSCAQW